MKNELPLILAANREGVAMVELLVNYGADPNATNRKNQTVLQVLEQNVQLENLAIDIKANLEEVIAYLKIKPEGPSFI